MSVREQQGPSHGPLGWEGAEQAEGKGRTEVRWATGEKGSSKQLCKVVIPRKHRDRRAKSEWLAKEMRTRWGGEDTEMIAQKECNGRLGPVDKRGKKQVVGDGKRDTWDKNLRKG